MQVGQSLGWLATAAALLAGAGTACRREQRAFGGASDPRLSAAGVRVDRASTAAHPAPNSSGLFAGNAWGMSEGQRLYAQMNCVGCHAHGGGGMGPALMDGKWIYGFEDATLFATIVDGRPNGMPAYRGRLSDDQVWQLVAYVKSLGGNESALAAPVRDDHMALRPGPARVTPQPITRQQP
jgi:cytochrome c oxidase cbb3-type subunit 3